MNFCIKVLILVLECLGNLLAKVPNYDCEFFDIDLIDIIANYETVVTYESLEENNIVIIGGKTKILNISGPKRYRISLRHEYKPL